VERQFVAATRHVDVALVRSPSHLQPQNIAVKALASREVRYLERDVPEAERARPGSYLFLSHATPAARCAYRLAPSAPGCTALNSRDGFRIVTSRAFRIHP
jgi:hypothetical protein